MENNIENIILQESKEHELCGCGRNAYSFACGAYFVIGLLANFIEKETAFLKEEEKLSSFSEGIGIEASLTTLKKIKDNFNSVKQKN